MKSIRQQIASMAVATVLVLVVIALMIVSYGNRAEYRSRATCKGLALHQTSIEDIGLKHFAEQISADTQAVTIVHKGALPFSQYWCTVKVKRGVVIEGETSHHWVW